MTSDTLLRSITSHSALLELTGGDPFVRWGIPDPLVGAVLAGRGAVAIERFGRRGRGLWVFPHSGGDHAAVRELLEGLVGRVAGLGTESISVPQEYADQLAATFELGSGGEWDWMWTDREPPRAVHEDRLIVLDDADDAQELESLATAHSPTGEGDPGTGRTQLWLGIRSAGGELLAAGAMQTLDSGAPHLAGIVTHTDHRGRGLGEAMVTELTQRAIAVAGVSTLGVTRTNTAAVRLYQRLGYRTAHTFRTTDLTR